MTNHTGFSDRIPVIGTPFVAISWLIGDNNAESWTLYDALNLVDVYLPDSDILRRFDTLAAAKAWAVEATAQRQEIEQRVRVLGTLKFDRNGNFAVFPATIKETS